MNKHPSEEDLLRTENGVMLATFFTPDRPEWAVDQACLHPRLVMRSYVMGYTRPIGKILTEEETHGICYLEYSCIMEQVTGEAWEKEEGMWGETLAWIKEKICSK